MGHPCPEKEAQGHEMEGTLKEEKHLSNRGRGEDVLERTEVGSSSESAGGEEYLTWAEWEMKPWTDEGTRAPIG